MANVKTMITIDEDLLQKVDSYCSENYLSRSAFLSILSNDFLKQRAVDQAIIGLNKSVSVFGSDDSTDIAKIRSDLNNILKYIENI